MLGMGLSEKYAGEGNKKYAGRGCLSERYAGGISHPKSLRIGLRPIFIDHTEISSWVVV